MPITFFVHTSIIVIFKMDLIIGHQRYIDNSYEMLAISEFSKQKKSIYAFLEVTADYTGSNNSAIIVG